MRKNSYRFFNKTAADLMTRRNQKRHLTGNNKIILLIKNFGTHINKIRHLRFSRNSDDGVTAEKISTQPYVVEITMRKLAQKRFDRNLLKNHRINNKSL